MEATLKRPQPQMVPPGLKSELTGPCRGAETAHHSVMKSQRLVICAYDDDDEFDAVAESESGVSSPYSVSKRKLAEFFSHSDGK